MFPSTSPPKVLKFGFDPHCGRFVSRSLPAGNPRHVSFGPDNRPICARHGIMSNGITPALLAEKIDDSRRGRAARNAKRAPYPPVSARSLAQLPRGRQSWHAATTGTAGVVAAPVPDPQVRMICSTCRRSRPWPTRRRDTRVQHVVDSRTSRKKPQMEQADVSWRARTRRLAQ